MEKLTYRISSESKAYLHYGADAKWQKTEAYDILDAAIQKLAYYEELEEKGLLKRIPQVGDKIWINNKNFSRPISFEVMSEPSFTAYSSLTDVCVKMSDIDNVVFLNEEAAKQAFDSEKE